MAEIPAIELDPQWFTIMAASETAVITRHNVSGNIDVWRLEWHHHGAFPASFAAEAWAKYMEKL